MDVPVGTVYPANVTEFRNSLDAKVVPVDRSFTRFYRVARYAKRHGVFDREILTALQGAGGGTSGGYPAFTCMTCFHVPC